MELPVVTLSILRLGFKRVTEVRSGGTTTNVLFRVEALRVVVRLNVGGGESQVM